MNSNNLNCQLVVVEQLACWLLFWRLCVELLNEANLEVLSVFIKFVWPNEL